MALNGFDDAIFAWVDFLSFATRDACAIVSIHLRHKEPKIVRRPVQVQRDDGSTTLRPEEREVERLVKMSAHWTNAPKPAADAKTSPFAFALVRRDRSVEDWFRTWTALRQKAKDGLDMLLSLTYGKNTFLQSDLLVVALGAETMHRGLFPDCLAMQPRNFETIINTATHGLAEEDAERIRRSFRNEPSYADRLRDLAALPHSDAVQVAVPNIKQWSRDLTAARNGLAHGLRKTNADLQHMYEVYERTRLLLELVVMAEIGLEPTHQEMFALEHRV